MTNHEPPSPQTRVLVVEDEPAVAQIVVEVMELDGHEVETAPNGLLALDMIKTRRYDLIISDLRMPELDGAGLYREVERRQPALLSRFLFVSGTADQPEYRRFLAESAVLFLEKPFTLAHLQELTRQVLSAHGPEAK